MRAPGRLLFAPFASVSALLAPSLSVAAESTHWIDLTSHPVGYAALSFFVRAYLLVSDRPPASHAWARRAVSTPFSRICAGRPRSHWVASQASSCISG